MKNVAKLCLFTYIVIIFLAAILSLKGTSRALNDTYIFEFRADYLIHAGLFLFLMFLISWAYRVSFKSNFFSVLGWTAIALSIAVVAEGVQYFLTYRSFNIYDLLSNVLGVIFGMAFFIRFKKRKN